ncbi:MAG: FkbM family methyltransferase [Thermodesulfobacteriota bacterium]
MAIAFELKRGLALAALALLRTVFRFTGVGLLDLFFGYRVILLRNPDADGWVHYVAAMRRGELSLEGLSNALLTSEEFQLGRGTPGEHVDYERRPFEEEVVAAHGCSLVIDRNDLVIGRAIRDGIYEPAAVSLVRRLVRPGQVVADVGANVGFFTILAARCVGPTGRVLAFEPIEHNRALLERSLALNELTNVALFPLALGERNGEAELIQWERRNSGSFHLLRDGRRWEGARYRVPVRRFDDVFRGERLDFVKIDVEGAEGLVLDGMQQAIERFRPTLLFEYSPAAIADISRRAGVELLEGLALLGYELFEIDEYLRGRGPKAGRRLARAVRRRGRNHVDLVAISGSAGRR